MTLQFSNFAISTLNGAYAVNGATITINTPINSASKFPTSGTFMLLITSLDSNGNPTNPELFLAQGAVGNTFNVTGGQEGTTKQAHANGELVQAIITGGTLQNLWPSYVPETGAGPFTFDGSSQIMGINPATPAATTVNIVTAGLIIGQRYTIADESGLAGTNPITITPDAGSGTFGINSNGGAFTFYWNGTNIIGIG